MTNTAPVPDERAMQYVRINDFSPGCYSNSWIVGSNPSSPFSAPGPYPAPLGAADANATYGCMNLPNGGIGPLPAMVQSHTLADFGLSLHAASQLFFLSVFAPGVVSGNSGLYPGDEIVLTQVVSISGTQTTFMNSIRWLNPGVNDLIYTNGTAGGTLGLDFYSAYPFTTRVAASSPTTTPGNPEMVINITQNVGTNIQQNLLIYPDPSAPGTFGQALITGYTGPATGGSGFSGFIFGHQGRIVAINLDKTAQWPAHSTAGVGSFAFECFNFTDPANSETWPVQNEIFGPENPFGYGAASSVSAGELFMVKTRGGAIVIQGDINNPTVTTLPGVKSTGAIYGQTATDPNGAYYCSQDEGAWVWNGGNASTKISAQLDDDFFALPSSSFPLPLTNNKTSIGINPYGYFCQRWGEWVLFSNNWMYNSASGGWWRLSNPANEQFFFYTPASDNNVMYAAITNVLSASSPCLFAFDRTQATNSYVWQSLPIRPTADDRSVNFREVVVRASNPTLDTNAQIAVSVIDGQGNIVPSATVWTLADSSPDAVQMHSFTVNAHTDSLVVSLLCTGTSASPIVYDIQLGYRARQRATVT